MGAFFTQECHTGVFTSVIHHIVHLGLLHFYGCILHINKMCVCVCFKDNEPSRKWLRMQYKNKQAVKSGRKSFNLMNGLINPLAAGGD